MPFTPATVPVDEFVSRMKAHWVERLQNISNEGLETAWAQIGEAYNSKISRNDDADEREKWIVIQPPTGSGKTQGTILYCSMLSKYPIETHPGVLIVTRLKVDAEQIAEQINKLGDQMLPFAIAHHSGTDTILADLSNYPVLVITHKAFQLSLDKDRKSDFRATWPFFSAWKDGERRLIVIDESLSLVEEFQVDLDGLVQTRAAIPSDIAVNFPDQILAIEAAIELMRSPSAGSNERIMLRGPSQLMIQKGKTVSFRTIPDFTPLRLALSNVPFEQQIGEKNNPFLRERIRAMHDSRLRALEFIFRRWIYSATVKGRNLLNASKLLIPQGARGAVVLDATASINKVYTLFDQVRIIEAPVGVRSYANVTLHFSGKHKVGKHYMEKEPHVLCEALVADLNARLGGKAALIITHKDLEPVLSAFDLDFKLDTAHWGKIDGSNEWRDCDTSVIFGLPYRPITHTANVYMAFKGAQEDSWFHSSSSHAPGGKEGIRKELAYSQIANEVIQAINRTQCRKTIDEKGNCPHTDIYILLPGDGLADYLLDRIEVSMPGINILGDWEFKAQKMKAKRSKVSAGLIKLWEQMEVGEILSKSEVATRLGISGRSVERAMKEAEVQDSELSASMRKIIISYEAKSGSKNRTKYFMKGDLKGIATFRL